MNFMKNDIFERLRKKGNRKNFIKLGIISILTTISIISFVKIGLFIFDYDSGKYVFLEVPIFVAVGFIIAKIVFEKIDFEQVVKVEDLSTLSDYEIGKGLIKIDKE